MTKLKYLFLSVLVIGLGVVMLEEMAILGGFMIFCGILAGRSALQTSDEGLKYMDDAKKEQKKREKMLSSWTYEYPYFSFDNKRIHVLDVSRVIVDVASTKIGTSYLNIICENGTKYSLPIKKSRMDEAINLQPIFALDKVRAKSQINDGNSATEDDRDRLVEALTSIPESDNKNNKDASVVGRAIAGQIIAGPTGAIVGALSAIDKNNKNRE